MKRLIENRWFLLVILTLTWGSSFIMIKKSLLVFSPYEIGSFRVFISGLLLSFIGIPVLRRIDKKTLWYILLAGLFGNYVPLYLFPLAQTKIDSSLAGILDSLIPVFVVILGFLFYRIKPKISQILGVILGFIGAASLIHFSDSSGGNANIAYSMLIVLACISYAVSALLIKNKLAHLNSIDITSSMFTIWAIPAFFMLLFGGTFSSTELNDVTYRAFGFISILSVMGTALAIMIYYQLIQKTGPIFASSVSYLLPIVAVMWGILDGEVFNSWYLLSGLLILTGINLISEKDDIAKPQRKKRFRLRLK